VCSLLHNLSVLERQFEYNKLYINILREEDKTIIEVIPDGSTAIEFTDFTLNGVQLKQVLNQKLIQARLGEEMQPTRTVFRYEVETGFEPNG